MVCHKYITINGNGRSVKAMVVDECDSIMGCDGDHDYQPPCPNNIVDVSKAVWKALGVSESEDNWGEMDITWRKMHLKCSIKLPHLISCFFKHILTMRNIIYLKTLKLTEYYQIYER
uniref:Ripening-related protein 2 n=1 Tax=Lactuca sativa TaxID=4236 RepID=A0A9R1XHE9_LACSA|nr:hypothetical protein LSAT_V11C400173270 [Lactuca sativa]